MADKSTWVKIDRNIRQWRWFKASNTVHVWLWLILSANIEDHDFKHETIHRGEIATSRKSIMDATGLTEQQVRTALEHLKSTGEITTRQGANYQVITIVSYDLYQSRSTGKEPGEQPASNRRATGEQPQSKNIRIKELKNEKNVCVTHTPPSADTHTIPSADEVTAYFSVKGRSRQDAEKFFAYNTSKGWKVGKTQIADWKPVADMWIAGHSDIKETAVPGYDPHPELDDFGRPIKPRYQKSNYKGSD